MQQAASRADAQLPGPYVEPEAKKTALDAEVFLAAPSQREKTWHCPEPEAAIIGVTFEGISLGEDDVTTSKLLNIVLQFLVFVLVGI